jgi:hypothetical protein
MGANSPQVTDEGYLTSSTKREITEEPHKNGKKEDKRQNRFPKGRDRTKNRKLKASDKEVDEKGYEETEDEQQDVCVALNDYGTPIRIYHCLKRPEDVAFDICLWEQQHYIDQLVDLHPDAPIGENIFIPEDAIFILVGEKITVTPYGHAIIFARLLHPNTSEECYEPIIGFYYSYAHSKSTICWSMSEYFNNAALGGIVDLYEQVRPENPRKFREVYGMISGAVNSEMIEIGLRRRELRNNYGANRVNATRWRSRIVGYEEWTERGY